MTTKWLQMLVVSVLVLAATVGRVAVAQQTAQSAYSSRAPLAQYMMPSQQAEIALARSAAPRSISDDADVMVLGPKGYTTAVKGRNGFLCIVERNWASGTDDKNFWNPKTRGPICFNPAAARTVAPIYLMKTKMVLAGKTKREMVAATAAALDRGELPALAPGAMCYMLSKEQYLGDDAHWHPHLMFFVSGDAAKSWGGNMAGSPVIAANDPEERMTIMMVVVGHWSDGSPAEMH
jgi:hypothetical protein